MLPAMAQKYFWDVNPRSLDVRKHERLIISRLLNYGRMDDWRWLIQIYGKNRLSMLLQSDSRLGVRESARNLAQILFS
jgi:hypothetical protein